MSTEVGGWSKKGEIMSTCTLSAFLSPLRHMKQPLLVTSCDSPAGIGASLWTHGRTTDGWTQRTDLEIVF